MQRDGIKRGGETETNEVVDGYSLIATLKDLGLSQQTSGWSCCSQ